MAVHDDATLPPRYATAPEELATSGERPHVWVAFDVERIRPEVGDGTLRRSPWVSLIKVAPIVWPSLPVSDASDMARRLGVTDHELSDTAGGEAELVAAILLRLVERVRLRDMLILSQMIQRPVRDLPGAEDDEGWARVPTEVLRGVCRHHLDFFVDEAVNARGELHRRVEAGEPEELPVVNWRVPGVPAWPPATTAPF